MDRVFRKAPFFQSPSAMDLNPGLEFGRQRHRFGCRKLQLAVRRQLQCLGCEMNALPQSPSSIASEAEVRSLLLRYRRENWAGIQPVDVQERLVETYLNGDWTEPLRRVAAYVQLSAKSNLLDLGCGVGSFVVACRKLGLQCFGVEPDRIGNGTELSAIQIARRRWAEPVFLAGAGENLPFQDGSFDLVTMNQVIEHVSDQVAVIREAVRVLRSGGVLYVNCPNYLRCYEPHYKIFWL